MPKTERFPLLNHAISILGGPTKAAKLLGFSRQRLWYVINKQKSLPSVELCEKIERLTKGLVTLSKLRPDIAKKFKK